MYKLCSNRVHELTRLFPPGSLKNEGAIDANVYGAVYFSEFQKQTQTQRAKLFQAYLRNIHPHAIRSTLERRREQREHRKIDSPPSCLSARERNGKVVIRITRARSGLDPDEDLGPRRGGYESGGSSAEDGPG